MLYVLNIKEDTEPFILQLGKPSLL